jgi:ABC-type transport system involved in multi-copper enzyme maturation permease subunit
MTMSPRARKLALTAHVVASVGWLGAIVAFLALAVVGVSSNDDQLVRAVYLAAEPLTLYVIVPLAVASLLTGLLQSVGTSWGLVRHYWVAFKLVINVVATSVLLIYTQTVSSLADTAADLSADLAQLRGATFILHAGVALLLLLAATVLAVFKPVGMTGYGRRKLQALRTNSSR